MVTFTYWNTFLNFKKSSYWWLSILDRFFVLLKNQNISILGKKIVSSTDAEHQLYVFHEAVREFANDINKKYGL